MAQMTDTALGGPPSQGTAKDKRLKRNKPKADMPAPGMPDPMMADTPAAGTPFTMLMCVEGLETSDGRMFELGSTSWREPPIPFMVQDTSPHGPGQTPAPAWAAGQIESIYRDPADASRIMGDGHLMGNDAGQRAEELIRGAMRGVSVDAYGDSPLGPDVQPTIVDENGDPISVLVRYADSVISRVTLVPTPAFAPCCVWLADEQMPQAAADASGSYIDPDAEPEVMQVPANAYELLVASGGGPLNPPRSWFFTPEPDRYQPIEVTADGHWTGHIAKAGQCYLGERSCKTAPMSNTSPPYKAFHRTVAKCDDGTEVACGFVTIGTKHAPALLSLKPGQVADQYDHTGTIGAKIRCSNGRHGVWSSGTLMPDLKERELAVLQGPEVSGDWRRWDDPDTGHAYPLELLGVLGVPFPAYPGTRTRPELLVASGGEVVAQVGTLDPACAECEEEDPMAAADVERITRLEFALATVLSVLDVAPEKRAETFALAPDDVAFLLATYVANDGREVDRDAAAVASLNGGTMTVSIDGSGDVALVDLSAPLSAAEQARYFAKYDQAARDKMAKSGAALPDGSYPIGDEEDLRAAIRAVGRGSGSHDTIRAHIIKRAKALGKSDLLPDNWNSDGSLKS